MTALCPKSEDKIKEEGKNNKKVIEIDINIKLEIQWEKGDL